MYEPEQFPVLIHRIRGSGVALIFSSGKTVIVGTRSYEQLNEAYFHLKQYFDNVNSLPQFGQPAKRWESLNCLIIKSVLKDIFNRNYAFVS